MEMEPIEISVDPRKPMNLFSKRFGRNPYPTLSKMREMAALVPVSDTGLRLWVVTRYRDVRRILNGRDFGKDVIQPGKELVSENMVRKGKTPKIIPAVRRAMVDRDGEDHRRLRAMLSPHLTREAVEKLRPRVEEITMSLVDRLPTGTPVDLQEGFARPLTAQVVAEWLGIPDEYVDQFPDWENKLLTGNGLDEVHAAEARFLRFTYEMLEHKRRNPGDDIYTMLLHIHEQDPEALSEEELLSTFMMLAIAGSEAAKALGNCLLSLMTHRDQFDLLRADPGLLDTAVHECLRYESSFRILSPRFSDKPFELDGVVLPPRSLLVCSVASANRDPDRFPEPDRLDITRHPNHHMSFGHGPHNCLGAGFALLELKTAVKALLDRFADIRLAIPPDELVWRPGMYMRRLNALPVVLVPHAAGAAGPSRSG